MSEQQRPWPLICPIPEEVRHENASHFRPRKIFLAPFYQTFYCPTVPIFVSYVHRKFKDSLESVYEEALRPKHDKLRYMYHYPLTYDYPKIRPDSIPEDILPIALSLLLIMSKEAHGSTKVLGYDDKDTGDILDLEKDVEDYKHDMLLYENQIPLEILENIVSIRKSEMQPQHRDVHKFVIDLILSFFGMPSFKEEGRGCLHILDVCRKSLLQRPKSIHSRKQPKFTKPPVIPSAKNLDDTRISITESKTSGLRDISFSKRTPLSSKRTLSLPQFSLDNCTESTFHNLVWFEKLDPEAGLHFSSYIYFISNLLKDSADSELLKVRGIIRTVWSDDKVVGLFKELGKNIDDSPGKPMDSHLLNVGQQLRARYNKNSEGWRKDLFQTYLKSPWAIISLIAAFVILSLTIIQTVYTVLGYYKS